MSKKLTPHEEAEKQFLVDNGFIGPDDYLKYKDMQAKERLEKMEQMMGSVNLNRSKAKKRPSQNDDLSRKLSKLKMFGKRSVGRRIRRGRMGRMVRGSRKRSRKMFGYSHSYAPRIYNVSDQDGILLADDAFSWMGNPTARALNS